MKNKLIIIILVVFAGFFFSKCKNSDDQKANSKAEDLTEEASKDNKSANKFCFRNEFPFAGNPSMKDVQELTLLIDGEKVTGTYNWLPAEKDRRDGTLVGTIKGYVISAQYLYMQEGEGAAAELRIVLGDGKAEISGGAPELGLGASIVKVDCR